MNVIGTLRHPFRATRRKSKGARQVPDALSCYVSDDGLAIALGAARVAGVPGIARAARLRVAGIASALSIALL
jgi:hypothetical protein